MEGSGSNLPPNDIPESSCLCKRKQPEGSSANPINPGDNNQPENTRLCTCRNQQQIIQQQITQQQQVREQHQAVIDMMNEEALIHQETTRNVRPRVSRRNQSTPRRYIADPNQQFEIFHTFEDFINNPPTLTGLPPALTNFIFHPTHGHSFGFLVNSMDDDDEADFNGLIEQESEFVPVHNVPRMTESIGVIESSPLDLVPWLEEVVNSYQQGMINMQLASGTLEVIRARAAVESMARQEGQDLASRPWLVKWKGLSEEDIHSRLERQVFNNNGSTEEVGACCVCLNDFRNNIDEIGKLDCAHQFHYECIKEWLKEKNSCPLCKRIALPPPKP